MNDQPTTLTERSVQSIWRSLRDFGYSGLTIEEVRATGNGLLDGTVKPDGDIIAMFMARMRRDAGLLPDEE